MRKPNITTHNRASIRVLPAAGIALASVLMLLLVITLLGTVSLRMSQEQETMSMNTKQLTRAQFAAEQAVRDAVDLDIWTLDPDPSDVNWGYGPVTVDRTSTDDYQYTYYITHKTALGSVVVDSEGFPYYVVHAEGQSGNARRRVEVAIVRQYDSDTYLDNAFIGCDGIPFDSNAEIWSYDSSGSFTDGNNGNIKTLNPNADIDLGSNAFVSGSARATGGIRLESNARIWKDAYANDDIYAQNSRSGYCTPPNSCGNYIKGTATTGGSVTGAGNSVPNPFENQTLPVVPTEDCDPLDIDQTMTTIAGEIPTNANSSAPGSWNTSYNDASVNKDWGAVNTDTDYYFTQLMLKDGPVDVYGNVRIFVDGDGANSGNEDVVFKDMRIRIGNGATLKIYVKNGSFKVEGGSGDGIIISPNGVGEIDPSQMFVFSDAEDTNGYQNDDPQLWVLADATWAGVMYAPDAHIKYDSNPTGYGAVRGKYAEITSNGQFFYDENLSNVTELSQIVDLGYKIVYWTEETYDSYGATTTLSNSGTGTGSVTTTTAGTPTSSPTTTTSTSQSATTSATTSSATSSIVNNTTTTTTTTSVDTEAYDFERNDGNKRIRFKLRNLSDQDCTITQIDFVNWPGGNDGYRRLKIRQDGANNPRVDDGGDFSGSVAIGGGDNEWRTGTSQGVSYIDRRTLLKQQGDETRLQFDFHGGAKTGNYLMTIRYNNCDDLVVNQNF